MEGACSSRFGLKTKLLLGLGVVVAVCIATLSWEVYTAFNQPLAAYGFLVTALVLMVVGLIAFLNRMMPSKQKPGEQVNL
jgi:uncharacterized membrane protein